MFVPFSAFFQYKTICGYPYVDGKIAWQNIYVKANIVTSRKFPPSTIIRLYGSIGNHLEQEDTSKQTVAADGGVSESLRRPDAVATDQPAGRRGRGLRLSSG